MTLNQGAEEMSAMPEFSWEWCDQCEVWFLRCPKCRNNSCNGGYGDFDGVTCDLCPSVYAIQDYLYTLIHTQKSEVCNDG